MLRTRALAGHRALIRAYATSPSPHALVFLEHRAGVIESASLSALTAAKQLGGQVTGLIVGAPEDVEIIVDKAKK
jgi:electron transfer flavoprotein alpha subunit